MKLDENSRTLGRTPRNLKEYLAGNSLKLDDFLSRVVRNAPALRKLFAQPASDVSVLDAIFVMELNGFKGDLFKVAQLIEGIHEDENKLRGMWASMSHIGEKLDVRDFYARLDNFFRLAVRYSEGFGSWAWQGTLDGRLIRLNSWAMLSAFIYDDSADVQTNAFRAQEIFLFYDGYFKNFLNTLYGDGDEGIKFVERDFTSLRTEYAALQRASEVISSHADTKQVSATTKAIASKREQVLSTLGKYPATVHPAVAVLLQHVESLQATA